MKGRIAVVCGLASVLAVQPMAQAHMHTGRSPGKRVIIDKTNQELRAYEGEMLVFRSNVSTGKAGKETPNGHYHAQGKSLMHYSTLYDNAPMPYSVQVNSNYFIHGFSYVPSWPASHGCIRLPVDSAREFYDWVHLGTPIQITGHWAGGTGPKRLPVAEKRRSFFARLFGPRSNPKPRSEPTIDNHWRQVRSSPELYPFESE